MARTQREWNSAMVGEGGGRRIFIFMVVMVWIGLALCL
jgi:hypothetical protein